MRQAASLPQVSQSIGWPSQQSLCKKLFIAFAKKACCSKADSERTVSSLSVRAVRLAMATPAADAQLDSYEKVAILAAKDAGA